MKTIFAHIEQAKAHPHHVRKQIAYVVAGVGAGLIAFIWIGISLAMDSFALNGPTSFGQGTSFAVETFSTTGTQLAAVGATLPSEEDTGARIEIIDAVRAQTSASEVEKTFIPF